MVSYIKDPVLGKVAHKDKSGVLEKRPKRKLIYCRIGRITDRDKEYLSNILGL